MAGPLERWAVLGHYVLLYLHMYDIYVGRDRRRRRALDRMVEDGEAVYPPGWHGWHESVEDGCEQQGAAHLHRLA